MFRDSLQRMVDRLTGGVAGILMGFDGISVESYTKDGSKKALDIQTVGMELAHAVGPDAQGGRAISTWASSAS